MRRIISVAVTLALSSCASAREGAPPADAVNVLYSMSLDQNDVLELSVYNPNEFSVCVSYADWPGPGDIAGGVLNVTGVDGSAWEYIGLIADTVGRARDLRIAPHSDATAHVTIRKNYKPIGSDDRIGKVYYGARFWHC